MSVETWTLPSEALVAVHKQLSTEEPEIQDSDALLIARAKGRDEKAYEELFNKYSGDVLGFVTWKLTPSGLTAWAEDVSLAALEQAWRRIDSLREDSKFLRWLIVIASRLCINFLRKNGRQYCTSDADLLEAILDETECTDVRQIVINREERDLLDAAIARLNNKDRMVVLEFLDGSSDSEVAKTLKMTVDQVNGRKRRAINKLKKGIRKGKL